VEESWAVMTGCLLDHGARAVDAQVTGRAGGQQHRPEGAVTTAEVDHPPADGITQLGKDGGLLHAWLGSKALASRLRTYRSNTSGWS
jgi:hypothetical protein